MAIRRNKTIYSTISLSLALWIMIISAGVVVDLHYCQNKIKNFALYTEAESCHQSEDVCPMHKKSCSMDDMQCNNDNDGEDNCCHNEKKIVKSKVKYTFDKSSIAKPFDFAVVHHTFVIDDSNVGGHNSIKPIYVDRPPPRDIDFQSLYQSYIL